MSLPAVRWKNIKTGVKMLNWQTDPFLSNYGIKISPNRTEVKGRILPTPEPTFLWKVVYVAWSLQPSSAEESNRGGALFVANQMNYSQPVVGPVHIVIVFSQSSFEKAIKPESKVNFHTLM